MPKIERKDFIDAVPIMPCRNSSWVMCFRICEEGRTQNCLSSPATIGLLARIQDKQAFTDINFASKGYINHIMVSFRNHENIISIDRHPRKFKLD